MRGPIKAVSLLQNYSVSRGIGGRRGVVFFFFYVSFFLPGARAMCSLFERRRRHCRAIVNSSCKFIKHIPLFIKLHYPWRSARRASVYMRLWGFYRWRGFFNFFGGCAFWFLEINFLIPLSGKNYVSVVGINFIGFLK